MKNLLLLIPFFLFTWLVSAQVPYDVNPRADVTRYIFALSLNDTTNVIAGETTVDVTFNGTPGVFSLDLIGKNGRFGMEVTGVLENGQPATYTYADNKISIQPKAGEPARTYTVTYHGIPERGLVIDTTKFGKRSFFGDNWPNLARHWLASVDNQHDKAAVEFRVTAPAHYDVVATGKKMEESYLENGLKLTRYVEPAPVATKVMTIGVCEFATEVLGYAGDIEISAWVYPENRLEGFSDYAVAVQVMDYFIGQIGPYAYAKLANMQAKTQWGGLENAGTIAYREGSVTGKNEVEPLIAHEIAHQWFGNSATEANWNHVWLSEGFATYFTILYLENTYGNERRKKELAGDREAVISYYQRNPSPIVDNSITEAMKVLSTNTYQKGSWVLNMLRHKLGDEVFWTGIRKYYETYANSNALTEDFRAVMEDVSGQSLEEFFNQWIYIKGFPEVQIASRYRNGKLNVTIQQVQKHHVFSFPLELGIIRNGKMEIKVLEVKKAEESFEIALDSAPEDIIIDPETWLLFQQIEKE